MPLALQDTALLWCAAAAAAPLVAHLVARTRPPRKLFPTVEFLHRAVKRVWRWRKPQDWLLLIVRTLAIAALALAFPRPVWLDGAGLSGAGAGKHLLLVVDRSVSMLAVEGGQARFSLATARALEALRSAGRLDSVNLVWLDATPLAVYPRMGRALQPLETALRDAKIMGGRGDAAAAIRLALEKLQEVNGAKELLLISDFQAETWKASLPEVPANIKVIKLRIGERELPNLALAGLDVTPAAPFAGENIAVSCRLRNAGPVARSANVAITLGEQRTTRVVEIVPWGEAQVILNLTAPVAGETLLQASLQASDEEALRADDLRWLSLRIREGLRVALMLPEDSTSAGERATWQHILASLTWTRLTNDSATADLLVLSGADAASVQAAREVVARGGSLLFRPTAKVPLIAVGGLDLHAELRTGAWEKRGSVDAGGWRLKLQREDAPLFQLFATGEFGDPLRGLFQERWHTAPLTKSSPELLLTFDDGAPALWQIRVPSGGSVWWWNLSMDPAAGTWPAQPAFLPLIGEALLLSRPMGTPPLHASTLPGQAARFIPDRFPEGGKVILLDHQDIEHAVVEDSTSGALAYRSNDGLPLGVYRWTLQEEALGRRHILAHTAVNFPEEEMDLRALPAAAITLGKNTAATNGAPDWAALRDGIQLWPWFIATALVFMILEGIILLIGRRAPRVA